MQISELLGGTKALPIPFPSGAVLTIGYDPSKVTAKLLDINSTDPADVARALCQVVQSWDLADGEGDIPVGPGNEDAVAGRVPLAVQAAVFTAVIQDQQVDPKKPAS